MLIDSFAQSVGTIDLNPSCRHYLLIDGAFVPGLHKKVAKDRRVLLFESLPGCSDETKDVSPFLVSFETEDRKWLRLCDRWPMISLIETHESLEELSERLSAGASLKLTVSVSIFASPIRGDSPRSTKR